jgi:hypothetical protein
MARVPKPREGRKRVDPAQIYTMFHVEHFRFFRDSLISCKITYSAETVGGYGVRREF